ncbi:Uncharacterized protein TPAR_06516 [Tolypocladium paradoxum]|uniref:Cupin 2 conserved barrel domain-containing protein n=1 Tax=Tolypocladium paradoxum TaxID=94208 RepID=A0A2S4KSX7_9HYPO|nr:Uncharacterized protein TPAR_06516 [Tolypocladium paradoxum]
MGKQHEAQVRSWGFDRVFTWSDGPNCHYAPHSHAGPTTHLVLAGEMTLRYPDEAGREGATYGVGARVDVDAGTVHEVWIGPAGCTYVVGE